MLKRVKLLYAAGVTLLWLGLVGFLPLLTAPVQAQELPEKAVLEKFPAFGQWYNLSCEYSATRIITAYWGREINDTQFINMIPFHSNPHLGFRGNINGPFGGTWDYGIYAEPIARVLEERGFKTKLLAGGAESLKRELALGRPVQVWVIAGMGWGTPYSVTYEGLDFKLAGGEHSIVIYGYDKQGVYVSDPAYGSLDYYSWDSFLRSWSYFDNMAMSIWPAPVDSSTATPDEGSIGISPYFYRHWLNAGGIAGFGYPISNVEVDGTKAIQYFERVRLAFDMNGSLNQPTSVGLLGLDLTANRQNEAPFLEISSQGLPDDVLFFKETGHSLGGEFRTMWEKNGGLNRFGFPLSQEFNEGGKVVQYFERARLEFYPEASGDYRVQLGRLGVEYLART